MKLGNYFFEFYNFTEIEEQASLVRFDVSRYEGYILSPVLKKASYHDYIDIDFEILRRSYQISFGLRKPVEYEFGLKKYKERQRANRDR